MLPSSIRCDSCYLAYNFPPTSSGLYLYALKYDKTNKVVKNDDLLFIPLKPIWCGVCNKPSFAEDFRTLKDWEDAFALAKSGKEIKFPTDTALYEDKRAVIDALKIWFNIREQRSDKGRCLFCGGFQYIELDARSQQ